jgi:hypothetical protein
MAVASHGHLPLDPISSQLSISEGSRTPAGKAGLVERKYKISSTGPLWRTQVQQHRAREAPHLRVSKKDQCSEQVTKPSFALEELIKRNAPKTWSW